MALDVLPPQDSVLWWVQRSEVPLQIAGLAVFEGAPLRDRAGALRMDDLAARVEASLADAPRLRQRVRQLPLAQAVAWEDDPGFDVAHHLSASAVPSPGGEAEVRRTVARVLEQPLDPEHPLWAIHVLDGLADDRVALVLKASHVLVDGTALLELAVRLLEPTPDSTPLPPAPPWRPARPSATVGSLATGMTARIGQVGAGLQQAGALILDPHVVTGAASGAAGVATGAVRHLTRTAAPSDNRGARRLPFTGRVGPRRAVAWARVPLDDVRRVARAESVTVNDVVLAVATGALAEHAGTRQARTRGPVRDPRVVVPMSVHEGTGDEARNRFSVVVTDLPIGLDDPLARLRDIHDALVPRRATARSSVGARVFALAGIVPPWLLRLGGRAVLDRQPVADLAITNLRGPAGPMYLLGARMLEVYPLVSGTGNLATIVGVLSYDGALGICVTVDADVVPDPETLLAGFPRSLDALLAATATATEVDR